MILEFMKQPDDLMLQTPKRDQNLANSAYPDEEADKGWDAEGRGVVAEPREVEGDLDAEVLRDVP